MILLSLTHTHSQHTHESDLAVAITGAADHQLLPIPEWPLASIMHDALVWSLWHAVEWTTALQLQLVQWTSNAWGWEVATLME